MNKGRFKSQALLDEKALLSCMAYVDLNPVRAKMAATPENSDFTSIQERLYHHAKRVSRPNQAQKQLIKSYQKKRLDKRESKQQQDKLKPLNGSSHAPLSQGLPFSQQDYFELVDWTGRQVRKDKRGAINDHLPPILERLGIETTNWIDAVTHFQKHFFDAAGTLSSLEKYQHRLNANRQKQKEGISPIEWIKGKGASKKLYG